MISRIRATIRRAKAGSMAHHRWTSRDYQSSHWRKVRIEAAARTEGLCQFCGLVEGTDGHHIRYQKPSEQEARWVTWLCRGCHDVATAIRKNGFGRASEALKQMVDRARDTGTLRAAEPDTEPESVNRFAREVGTLRAAKY